MLGSSTSSTVSTSSFPVCRISRTSWALSACRASRNCCFSCLTASCLGLNSSMSSLKERPRSKPAVRSDTNVLHTAWRRLEIKAQMLKMKVSTIPTTEGLREPSHQIQEVHEEEIEKMKKKKQQVTGGRESRWSEIRLNINRNEGGREEGREGGREGGRDCGATTDCDDSSLLRCPLRRASGSKGPHGKNNTSCDRGMQFWRESCSSVAPFFYLKGTIHPQIKSTHFSSVLQCRLIHLVCFGVSHEYCGIKKNYSNVSFSERMIYLLCCQQFMSELLFLWTKLHPPTASLCRQNTCIYSTAGETS